MADELSEAAQLAKAAMAHPAVMQLLSDLTGWGDMDMARSGWSAYSYGWLATDHLAIWKA